MRCVPIIAVGLLAISRPVSALEFACPDTIMTSEQLDAEISGWSQFLRPGTGEKQHRSSPIAGIDLYDGDPNEIVQLVPDNQKDTWTFTASANADRPLFMACVYLGTKVQLIKPLPMNIRKCTIRKKGVLNCELFNP